MKKFLIVTFGVILWTNVFCQDNCDVDRLMQIISEKINRLPLTLSSEINGRKFKTKYSLRWEKSKKKIILTDKRFFSNTNRKMPESYKDFFFLKDLHPDGICLKYSEDSLSVYLQLFTANNKYSVISKNYRNGLCRFTNYYDRVYFGDWDEGNISKLIEIQHLFKMCIKLESDWNIESAPDIACPINLEQMCRKEKNMTAIRYDRPLMLNTLIEKPALFLNSKSECENRKIIKNYVLQRLKDKKIKYRGNTVGTIIIDPLGNVVDFKFIRKKSDSMGNKIKEILLSMPQWIPANLDGNSIEVGQTIII